MGTQNEELIQGMNQLGKQMGLNNELLLQNVQQMIRKADYENRKKRRKKIGEQLIVTDGSYIGMTRYFDDGSNEYFQLSNILTGESKVYSLDFQGVEKTEKFGIYFNKQNIWIVGDKKKVKPEYLLDCFVKAAGSFNQVISRTIVAKLLYDYWAASIEQTENQLTLPIMAGWNNEKFLYRENYIFKKTKDFPDIPVLQKRFEEEILTKEMIHSYLDEFLHISDERARFLIVLYPYLGVLSSIFNTFNVSIEFCLNLIVTETTNRRRVCSWFKIFNRECLYPRSLDISEKELNRMIATSNDEILICDADTGVDSGNYKVQKIRRNARKVIDGMKKQGDITNDHERRGCYACVLLSNERIIKSGVQNIILDVITDMNNRKELFFAQFHVMEGILSDFISYVERNIKDVWGLITKTREGIDRKSQALVGIYEIVNDYWKNKGIDILKELKIQEYSEWNSILKGSEYADAEMIESFIEAIRKGIKYYTMVEKRRNVKYDPYTIYYTQDFLYIPTKIVRKILVDAKLSAYLKDILLILKEKKELATDVEGYSNKIHISVRPVEVYQIRREFFNSTGMIDIVDLGKEEMYVTR